MSFFYYLYGAVKSIPDAAACSIPPIAVILLSIWHAIKKRRGLYIALCALVHLVAAALYFPRMEVGEALFCLAAGAALNIPLALLSKIKRAGKKQADPIGSFAKECLNESAVRAEEKNGTDGKFRQEKILCYTDSRAENGNTYSLDEEGISLNHAIGLATKLKRARLAVGDRLEADNIYRILMDFNAKNNLTGEEFSALNGYLSTLLKLTAKYSL